MSYLAVTVVLPEMLPNIAVMVAPPAVTAVTKPLLLTVATDVLEELQVTWVVRLTVVLSENVPVAVSAWVAPTVMIGLAGVIAREDRVAELTVRVVVAEMLPD